MNHYNTHSVEAVPPQKRGSWREAVLDYRSGPNRRRTTREAHAYADNIIGGVE